MRKTIASTITPMRRRWSPLHVIAGRHFVFRSRTPETRCIYEGPFNKQQGRAILAQLMTFHKENRRRDKTFHPFYICVGLAAFQEKLTEILAKIS
ncbi:hypothetical protein [Gordoniibacillus kamchatkensis]|uniref:hypothetical protein n=1 Tax=Gordoniibacillus kamchatkensis TaxID=1590651 RepID=UPI0012E002BC|nr:hypothetical protein [Paenibacillus sp. VKM B-2647]